MELTNEQHAILIKWAKENLIPWDKFNHRDDTSLLRESFMKFYIHGFYLGNPTMNDILRECGFTHAPSNSLYLNWNVSPKSRAIQIYRSYLRDQSKDWRYK